MKNFTCRTCAISKIFMASWSATRQTVINPLREKSYNRARTPLSDTVSSPSPVSSAANLRISNFLPFSFLPPPHRTIVSISIRRSRDRSTPTRRTHFCRICNDWQRLASRAMYRVIPSKTNDISLPMKINLNSFLSLSLFFSL